MGQIQYQISEPTFNLADGRFYQRTRWIYEDALGNVVVSSEQVYSSETEDGPGMFDPSDANQAQFALQSLLSTAGNLVIGSAFLAALDLYNMARTLNEWEHGNVPPGMEKPYGEWPGTDTPWDPIAPGSDPNPQFLEPLPYPLGSGNPDPDGPGWFDPNGPFFFPPISPLVLDLDGDGLDIVTLNESTAYFDLNEDGLAEKTAWISAEDGFLARDVNGDGQINDLSELFGGTDVDGFTRLAELDSNGDGKISAADAAFSELVIWRDVNGDGVSDQGELSTLAELSITEIDLNADFVDYWDRGNWISHKGGFTVADGAAGDIYDIWFDNNQALTVDRNTQPHNYPIEIALLPNLAGYGDVPDLSVVLTGDAQFAADFTAFVLGSAALSGDQLRNGIEDLLLQWTGADRVAANSRGAYVDGQHLAFLEALHGQAFVAVGGSSSPGQNAGRALESYYQEILDSLTGKLAVQLPVSMFALSNNPVEALSHPVAWLTHYVVYDPQNDTLATNLPGVADYLTHLVTEGPGGSSDDAEIARDFTEKLATLRLFRSELGTDEQPLSSTLVDLLDQRGLGSSWTRLAQVALDDVHTIVFGTAGSDTMDLPNDANGVLAFFAEGDDELTGGDGNDTYLYARGHGNDAITEASFGGSADKLYLQDIDPADVSLVRNGGDVALIIAESSPGLGDGSSILLTGSLDEYNDRGIEQIMFENGTTWTRNDLREMLLAQASTPADDTIAGFTTADVLDGGTGDDTLRGGNGSDTYVFGRGYGHDIVDEAATSIFLEEGDRVLFAADITPDDIRVTRNGDTGYRAIFTIEDTGDQLEVLAAFDGTDLNDVETFEFADGTVWTLANLRNLILEDVATDGDDVIYGFDTGAETLCGLSGDDMVYGGAYGDTYLFDRGDGWDKISDIPTTIFNDDAPDYLIFGGAILPSDVRITRFGNDLRFDVAGTDDHVTVSGHFLTDPINRRVEEIRFADGTTWTYGAVAAAFIWGTSSANALTGTANNDYLDGLAGADTMTGGTGHDSYFIDSIGDVVVEFADEGIDAINSSVSYALGNHLEDLFLAGNGAINGTGNAVGNVIVGNGGANILDGGAGSDTMRGGAGNDTYVVDVPIDVVIEKSGEGVDTIVAPFDYILPDNFENLTLTGNATSGVGNTLDNLMVGNALGNTLISGAGSDTLNGGTGDDTLIGGVGNDTYVVDSLADTLVENADEGIDTVQTPFGLNLTDTNFENVTLTGNSAVNATGNERHNILTGNAAANQLVGGAGNDVLDGGAGVDTMVGGAGDDTYFLNGADIITEGVDEGIDTVKVAGSLTLAANVEIARLNSGFDAWALTGNALNNELYGNGGFNTLNGGSGADIMAGGGGRDTYYVDNASDVIVEDASGSVDTVNSSVSYALAAYVENLTLAGSASIDGTGNGGGNEIDGNSGNNILIGLAGDDVLDGFGGNDTLVGGMGNDIYVVGEAGDVVTELAGEGTDTVRAYRNYTLGDDLENLTMMGSAALSGTGNGMNNTITGNTGANLLSGGTGNDTIFGGNGNDALYGGDGDDWLNGEVGLDALDGGDGNDTASYTYVTSGTWLFDLSAGIAQLDTSTPETLVSIENLVTGAGTDTIVGTSGDNTLKGGGGVDTIRGGSGNDWIDGEAGNDLLTGGAGVDTLVMSNGLDRALYTDILDSGDILAGFADTGASQDVIDLDALFDLLDGGIANAERASRIQLAQTSEGVELRVDTGAIDGADVVSLLLFQGMTSTAALTVGTGSGDDIQVGTL